MYVSSADPERALVLIVDDDDEVRAALPGADAIRRHRCCRLQFDTGTVGDGALRGPGAWSWTCGCRA